MPTPQERYERAFTPPPVLRAKRLGRDVSRKINRFFSDNSVMLVHRRERVSRKVLRVLESYLQAERVRLIVGLDENGSLESFRREAVDLYHALRLPGESDTIVQRKIAEYLDRNEAVERSMLTTIERTAIGLEGGFHSELERILRTAYVLWAEVSGLFFASMARLDANEVIASVLHPPDLEPVQKELNLTGFSKSFLDHNLNDNLLAAIVFSSEPKLLDAIISRQNEIKTAKLTAGEFQDVKNLIRRDLYERVGGGLGAEELARNLVRDLGHLVPGDQGGLSVKQRAMLWVRTEGATMQNDALMAIGSEAGMEGKIWQTVGDSKVRRGHAANEADGIIPVAQDFSDGSSDGGSGSVSPYNCRCAVGPALLP